MSGTSAERGYARFVDAIGGAVSSTLMTSSHSERARQGRRSRAVGERSRPGDPSAIGSAATASRDQRVKPSDRTRLRVAPSETTPRVTAARCKPRTSEALPMTSMTCSTVPRPPQAQASETARRDNPPFVADMSVTLEPQRQAEQPRALHIIHKTSRRVQPSPHSGSRSTWRGTEYWRWRSGSWRRWRRFTDAVGNAGAAPRARPPARRAR